MEARELLEREARKHWAAMAIEAFTVVAGVVGCFCTLPILLACLDGCKERKELKAKNRSARGPRVIPYVQPPLSPSTSWGK